MGGFQGKVDEAVMGTGENLGNHQGLSGIMAGSGDTGSQDVERPQYA